MTAAANLGSPSKGSARRAANALPSNHLLDEYRIDAILGAGGFGVTYKALDTHLENWVAIKEYFPIEWSFRAADGVTVYANTQGQSNGVADQLSDYEWGLERFLDEARVLARIQHPYVVRVKRYFRGHGTAYIVMDYEEGEPLNAILRDGETLGEGQVRGLLEDVLPALQAVHEQGYLHRDIKPSNLYVRSHDHRVILIDFGAARAAISRRSQSVSSLVTPGYSPPEQYSTRNDRYGPWTDIYALGAVLYRCVAGQTPVEAADRLMDDTLKPAIAVGAGRYSTNLLRAIDRALAVRPEQRFRDVVEMQAGLNSVQDEDSDETVIMAPLSKADRLPDRNLSLLHAVSENTGRVARETIQPLQPSTASRRLSSDPWADDPSEPLPLLKSNKDDENNHASLRRWLWGAVAGAIGLTAAAIIALWPSAPVQEAEPSPSSSVQQHEQHIETPALAPSTSATPETSASSLSTPSASAAVSLPKATTEIPLPVTPPAVDESERNPVSLSDSDKATDLADPSKIEPVPASSAVTEPSTAAPLPNQKPEGVPPMLPTEANDQAQPAAIPSEGSSPTVVTPSENSSPTAAPPTQTLAPAIGSSGIKPRSTMSEQVAEKKKNDVKKPPVRSDAEEQPKTTRQRTRRNRTPTQPVVVTPSAPVRPKSAPARTAPRSDNPWDSPTSTGFNQK